MKNKLFDFQSVFHKLLISMILVVIPVILSGIMMFDWGKQAIRSEIENNAKTNVTSIRQNLENEIQNIMKLQYDLAEDTLLKRVIISPSLPTYEYYTLISDLQIRLSVMKNSHKLLQDVSIYYPALKRTISVRDGFESLNWEKYNYLRQLVQTARYPLLFDNGAFHTCIEYPSKIYQSESTIYLIDATLIIENFQKIFTPASNYPLSFIALYDFTSNAWVLNSNSIGSSPEMSTYVLNTEAASGITTEQIRLADKSFYVAKDFSKDLNLSVVEFIPIQDVFQIPNTYGLFLWFYAVFAIFVLILYAYLTHRSVKRPLDRIVDAFQRLDHGDLEVRINQKAAKEFNYLYDEFNNMVLCLDTLINNDYKQKIMAQKAELKQLQSQINPHFLYNSYFMLDRMIRQGDLENAQQLSTYLGKYFRYITRNSSDEVTLAEETSHAACYANIQQMRFSRRLSVYFGSVPEIYQNLPVPRMILQPIIENAIEYGLRDVELGGLLEVGFRESGDWLSIMIDDNGNGLSDCDISDMQNRLSAKGVEVTALINVHRRIQLHFCEGSGLWIKRSDLGGLQITIRIHLPEAYRTEREVLICTES